MLKQARRLARPTLAASSPSRPASAKTGLLPKDAPFRRQGRASEETRRYGPHFAGPFALVIDLGERKSPSSTSEFRKAFVEPLSDARTMHGKWRVLARRGWASEKSDLFSILREEYRATRAWLVGVDQSITGRLARMIHERFCCNRGFAALGREASSVRETSFVKRISFRSLALHVSHLLPALHTSRDTPFDGLRASRACRGTLHSLLRFTRNAFSWRFRPSTVLGTLSFVEGPRTVMNHAG